MKNLLRVIYIGLNGQKEKNYEQINQINPE